MVKWIGLAGLVLWLAGTVGGMLLLSWGIITEPVRLHLRDGTPICGTLYRPSASPPKLPAAIVVHGLAAAHPSCAPGLAIPLAENGYLVLAIDLRGHGRSGGAVPRHELDAPLQTLAARADHPEIEAAIDFLKQHPLFLGEHIIEIAKKPLRADRRRQLGVNSYRISCLAVIGHSWGGWAAAAVGCHRPDVAGVVSVGVAPQVGDRSLPHNFLILTGGQDELFPAASCRQAIARVTGGAVDEPDKPFGEFWVGTARRLLKVNDVNHFSELLSPRITRAVVQWVGSSLDRDAGEVPGNRSAAVIAAVAAASVGGLLACGAALALAAGRLLGPSSDPVQPGSGARLAIFFALLLLAVPATADLAAWVESGPVYFAGPAVTLLACVALSCRAAATGMPCPSGGQGKMSRDTRVIRGLVLGLIGLGSGLLGLGIPWGMTWASLVPAPPRLLLLLALLPLLFPWSLALALGLQRLAGNGPACRRAALARGLVWQGIAVVLWFAYRLLLVRSRPLFLVPVGLVAAGFLIPLPLWLLPNRAGMAWARAVSHAGATAWLLACHLPFVDAG